MSLSRAQKNVVAKVFVTNSDLLRFAVCDKRSVFNEPLAKVLFCDEVDVKVYTFLHTTSLEDGKMVVNNFLQIRVPKTCEQPSQSRWNTITPTYLIPGMRCKYGNVANTNEVLKLINHLRRIGAVTETE